MSIKSFKNQINLTQETKLEYAYRGAKYLYDTTYAYRNRDFDVWWDSHKANIEKELDE